MFRRNFATPQMMDPQAVESAKRPLQHPLPPLITESTTETPHPIRGVDQNFRRRRLQLVPLQEHARESTNERRETSNPVEAIHHLMVDIIAIIATENVNVSGTEIGIEKGIGIGSTITRGRIETVTGGEAIKRMIVKIGA